MLKTITLSIACLALFGCEDSRVNENTPPLPPMKQRLHLEPADLTTSLGTTPAFTYVLMQRGSAEQAQAVATEIAAETEVIDLLTGQVVERLEVSTIRTDEFGNWYIDTTVENALPSTASWIGLRIPEQAAVKSTLSDIAVADGVWATFAVNSQRVINRVVHCSGAKNYVDVFWSDVSHPATFNVQFTIETKDNVSVVSSTVSVGAQQHSRLDIPSSSNPSPGAIRVTAAVSGTPPPEPVRFARGGGGDSIELWSETMEISDTGECVEWVGKFSEAIVLP